LLERSKVEHEYTRLYEDIGLGMTTWSPLASGLWTGKYLDGVPSDARLGQEEYAWLRDLIVTDRSAAKVRAVKEGADDLGCSLAQLAIAWCTSNPRVTSVILGASRVSQLEENLAALDVVPLLTDDVRARIEAALQARP